VMLCQIEGGELILCGIVGFNPGVYSCKRNIPVSCNNFGKEAWS
jgi:hypothetical protein